MKIFFMIFLLVGNLLAFDGKLVVINLQTSKRQTFEGILSKAKLLKYKTVARRRDFEPLSVYEDRIKKAEHEYDKYLENEYRIGFKPDKVNLDWENSSVQIVKKSNVPIIRKRGMSNSHYKLSLMIFVSPMIARQLKVFPNAITVTCEFKISRSMAVIIKHLKIKYREEVLYEE